MYAPYTIVRVEIADPNFGLYDLRFQKVYHADVDNMIRALADLYSAGVRRWGQIMRVKKYKCNLPAVV